MDGNSALQLPLSFSLREGADFGNFVDGPNALARQNVRLAAEGTGDPYLYIWGGRGIGKTHLLEAACRLRQGDGSAAALISLHERSLIEPEMLQGLELLPLVCVDDLDQIAGDGPWQEALFHLYNRVRDTGTRLVMSGRTSPAGLGLELRDLASRLSGAIVFRLKPLDDAQRAQVLQRRALELGLRLPDDAVRFLLRHQQRDLHFLVELLERLDRASLAAQRRLTLRFIQEFLQK